MRKKVVESSPKEILTTQDILILNVPTPTKATVSKLWIQTHANIWSHRPTIDHDHVDDEMNDKSPR